MPEKSDFDKWLEAFATPGTPPGAALRLEPLAYPHVLTGDQAVALAGRLLQCAGRMLTREVKFHEAMLQTAEAWLTNLRYLRDQFRDNATRLEATILASEKQMAAMQADLALLGAEVPAT